MRILFVIHTWPPEGRGGSEHHAHEVALELQARGHQVGVFCRTGDPDLGRYEVTTGLQEEIGITRFNNLYWHSPTFEWIYKNRWAHEAFLAEVEEFKPDLVHIHHFIGLSTTIVEALKRRKIPVVMTLHDFWTVCPRGQRMTKDLDLCWEVDRGKCFNCLQGMWPHLFRDRDDEQTVVDIRGDLSPRVLADYDRHMTYVLNLCDRLITPSEFHRERMLDFPLDPDRIVSLPHGLNKKPFDGTLRSDRKPRVIGFIGSVFPIKGVHVLIEAFKLLAREDLHLAIHGETRAFHEDDTYPQRLKELAEGREDISFHGAYDPIDIPMLLADIDILVIPSLWWETYCLTIREGLLAGIPVVAPDLGAMREALDGERDGVLYRPGDPADLAAKLGKLLGDAELLRRYANRGSSVKSLETYIGELEGVYETAVQVSVETAPTLAIAPSSFPEDPVPEPAGDTGHGEASTNAGALMTVPWSDLGVAVRHQGSFGISFSTRMPTDDKPALGLDITLTEGNEVKGQVGVVVDLRAIQGQIAAPADAGAHDLDTERISSQNGSGSTSADASGSKNEGSSPSPARNLSRVRVGEKSRGRSTRVVKSSRHKLSLPLGRCDPIK